MPPVCVDCGFQMRCHKNGQPVCTTEDPEKQRLHEFFHADVYRCPGCGARVAVGFSAPTSRLDDTFQREIAHAGDDLLRVF